MNQTRRLMSSHHLDDYYDDLLEAQEKIKKLEGWLKALVPYIERSGLYDDLIKEVYAYIKAMEGKP